MSQSHPSHPLFAEKNTQTLYTVLAQEFEEKHSLDAGQRERLSKTVAHYQQEVYQKLGRGSGANLVTMNREVLTACSKDFGQYLQRRGAGAQRNASGVGAAQQVMDERMYQDTAQRLEAMNKERQGVKALPPPAPDFRISLSEDGPPAAELFERAKRAREAEALRAAQASQAGSSAASGMEQRIAADALFRQTQTQATRASEELALALRAPTPLAGPAVDRALIIPPDRRDLLLGAVGSFDGMGAGVGTGTSTGNPTVAKPVAVVEDPPRVLPQSVVVKESPVVHYREVESNLFLYSADRDWLKNSKENRYQFTVQFDPAANGQTFGVNLSAQHRFKNIVRIELVKAILPGENVEVTVQRTRGTEATSTAIQQNILSLPYVTVRVAELENNNYGTDQHLDRSFGVLQYDAQWLGDGAQTGCSKGFLAMIPKFLKCQKEYYPTPLSTLQKMTIEICRPNGQLVSATADTFDVGGVIGSQVGEVMGAVFPFTNTIKYSDSPLTYNVMMPAVGGGAGSPANFYVNTTKWFSKFEMCAGDRIQISGYTYAQEALDDPVYGGALRAFSQWINRPEGHIVLDAAYSVGFDLGSGTSNLRNGWNEVGYANFLVIAARYQDPTTGSTALEPFAADFGAVLNAFGVSMVSPVRLINLNKQTSLVFRVITREMDALPQLRPDNNY